MKSIFILSLTWILASCALAPEKPPVYAFSMPDKEGDNALVLFRAISGWHKPGISGLSVRFKNLETQEEFVNNAGHLGYPKKINHALWLPEGRYELLRVFFWDGGMKPIGNGYQVEVKAGEVVYIGTITQEWSFPSYHYEKPLKGKIYTRSPYKIDPIYNCSRCGEVYILQEPVDISDFIFDEQYHERYKNVVTRLLH